MDSADGYADSDVFGDAVENETFEKTLLGVEKCSFTVPASPRRAKRSFTEMPIQHDKHLRSMKELLSTMDPQSDPNAHIEFKEKTHILCARFLGGAWKTVSLDNLKIHRIKGGMSNMLFLCRLTENHPPLRNEPDKVLLRVYFNPETESHLVAESSRPLTVEEISIPTMSNKIAKRIARVHQLEVPIWKEPDYVCDALERWLSQLRKMPSGLQEFELPEKWQEWAPATITCDELFEEIESLRTIISKSKSAVAFCHNDLQEGNILLPKASSGNIRMPSLSEEVCQSRNSLSAFNPTDPRLVLIDFEYASYNYRGFDFANHFVEFSINYNIDYSPYYEMMPDKFPSKKQMHDFMLSYLKELHPGLSESSLEPQAEAMVMETIPFIPVSHLFWGVWGLLQVEVSPVGFGFAMRDLLANLDPTVDPCIDVRIREKIHALCAQYVGGSWKQISPERIELQKIRGATSNILFICGLNSNICETVDDEPKKILLRVYFNPDKESNLVADTAVFMLLSERGLGPKLFGVFDDGRLEEYINSRPLSTDEIAIPNVSAVIARKLAHIHKLHVPIWKEPDYLEKALERWLQQLCSLLETNRSFETPERFHDMMPKSFNCDDLATELSKVKDFFKRTKSIITFCHNDLQEGNILIPLEQEDQLNDDKNIELVFIDFEYASYNFRGFDFANHFVEYTLCYDVDQSPYYEVRPDSFPKRKDMKHFMVEYLQVIKPNQSDAQRLLEAEEMIDETLPFVPISHFFWGVWALIQAKTSPLTFGFEMIQIRTKAQ
ncbi:hypothetical protein M3Y98_00323300 [Aphelenchoides besseyi]|nr:hypothetical protein M3Y98_00323300 [Aphelenchoides besseyi]